MKTESILREDHRRSTVGMLAGGVAHEFNNLLAGIQGAVEMLSMVVVENPKAKGYLDVILRMGNRAIELTHQLLAYARQGKYAPAVIPVKEIVGDAVAALGASLPAGIDLSVEVEEGIPHVFVDAQQMRQVLMGLCLNAAEAMPGGRPDLGAGAPRGGREAGRHRGLRHRARGSTRRRCRGSSSRSSRRRAPGGGWGWRRSAGSSRTMTARSGPTRGRGKERPSRSCSR